MLQMSTSRPIQSFLLCLSLAGLPAMAQGPAPNVKVEGAWARATAPGQLGTGAYMNFTAASATQLIGVSTPAAGVAEVHEMKMEGDIMRMRAVAALDLPAGKTVQLKPGSYHLMLMELKAPLAKGSRLPLTLLFKDAKGVESQMNINVPVGMAAPGAGSGQGTGSGGHKH